MLLAAWPCPPADALGTDFRALHTELLNYGGYRPANLRRVAPAQLTPDWLQQSGGFRPVLVPAAPGAARDMGLALPEGSLTVDRLASKIGLPFEVRGGGPGRHDSQRGTRPCWARTCCWRVLHVPDIMCPGLDWATSLL